ncbi:MAG: hypothetical protein CVV18_07170 [Gammaproteobacteria bacterium HGW-Gammaproteobacteria-8]|nr:MAG: hypothetical protein CVV18_07170 [Gammaproteobacteria bacterium HGW-Gammaproteobacteria-8]
MTEQQEQEQDKASESVAALPGRRLQAMREQQQLSISEVASLLRLPARTIEQIERGEFDRIGSIYRRGYVASYARLLGLDPDPLLNQLGPAESEPLRPVLPVRRSRQNWGRLMNFATYALVSGAIVAPLVYFFVLGGARLFESELAGVTQTTTESEPQTALRALGYRERVVDALALTESGDSDRASLHLSASALPLNAMRPAEASLRPERPLEEPEVPESSPEPPDLRSTLRLDLSGDSWVEVEDARGERLEFDLLRAGTTREYSGYAPFRVLFGRAHEVSVQLDGRAVTYAGGDRAGVVETVIGAVEADSEAVEPVAQHN